MDDDDSKGIERDSTPALSVYSDGGSSGTGSESSTTSTEMDFLTCGSCQREFLLSDITVFMRHKKKDCDDEELTSNASYLYQRLMCQIKNCKEKFATAVGLLQHIKSRHALNLFLGSLYSARNDEVIYSEQQERLAEVEDDDAANRDEPSEDDTCQGLGNACEINALTSISLGEGIDDVQKRAPCLTGSCCTGSKDGAEGGCCGPGGRCTEACCGAKKSLKDNKNNDKSSQSEMTKELELVENDCDSKNCNPTICAQRECCDNQNCCITLIPGTHEKLKRCCSAVVPKKRKQHMERKHMPRGFSARSAKRRVTSSARNKTKNSMNHGDTIFIDLQPSGSEKKDGSSKKSDGNGTELVISKYSNPTSQTTSTVTNRGQVIIEPGMTYTIPVSYPFSTSTATTSISQSVLPLNNAAIYHHASSHIRPSTEEQQYPQVHLASPQQISSPRLSVPASPTILDLPLYCQPGFEIPASPVTISPTSTDTLSTMNKLRSTSLQMSMKKRRYPTTKPFKCDQCDNSFNQRIHLKKHLSKHTGIKPFKCGQCDYSTVERSHLKVHIRIHTGEKPFKCTYCEYATAQNSTLKIHLKRHHNGDGLNCAICGKKFTQPNLLTNHCQEHKEVSNNDDQIGTSPGNNPEEEEHLVNSQK